LINADLGVQLLALGQFDRGAVELINDTFVHGIHQGADAGGFGHAVLTDLRPYILPGGTKTLRIVDLIGSLVQAFVGFCQFKRHPHAKLLTGVCYRKQETMYCHADQVLDPSQVTSGVQVNHEDRRAMTTTQGETRTSG